MGSWPRDWTARLKSRLTPMPCRPRATAITPGGRWHWSPPLYLGSLAAAIVLRPRSLSLTLGAGLLAYLEGYELLRVPSFSWYYGPPAIVIALLLWMGLQRALALIVRRPHWRTARLAPAATLTMGLAALVVLVAWTPRFARSGRDRSSGRRTMAPRPRGARRHGRRLRGRGGRLPLEPQDHRSPRSDRPGRARASSSERLRLGDTPPAHVRLLDRVRQRHVARREGHLR